MREVMRHLPKENRNKAAWRYVAAQLDKAATGTVDTVEVEIALRLVLMLEGVKCRPKRRRAGSPPPLVARGVRRGVSS